MYVVQFLVEITGVILPIYWYVYTSFSDPLHSIADRVVTCSSISLSSHPGPEFLPLVLTPNLAFGCLKNSHKWIENAAISTGNVLCGDEMQY